MKNINVKRKNSSEKELRLIIAKKMTTAAWLLNDYSNDFWLVKAANNEILKIDFDMTMPDGKLHSHFSHHHRMESIKRATFDARGFGNEKIDGYAQYSIARDLMLLSYWSALNHIMHFSDFGDETAADFIRASSYGIEFLTGSLDRVEATMKKIVENGRKLSDYKRSGIVAAAGLNTSWMTKFLHTNRYVDACIAADQVVERPEPEKQQLSVSAVNRRVASIERLWEVDGKENDTLPSSAFSDELYGLAKAVGKVNGHTKSIPVDVAFHLVRNAIEWVSSIGPVLLDFEEKARAGLALGSYQFGKFSEKLKEEFFSRPEIQKLPREIFVFMRGGYEVLNVRGPCFTHLAAACYVIIVTLTARRKQEVLKLREGAVSGNEIDGWWLHSIIEKTLQREDSTPCSDLVVKAVKLLERMSKVEERDGSDKCIFHFPLVSGEGIRKFSVDTSLRKFPYVTVSPQEAEVYNSWSFSSHQFRRLFAILFVWRYEGDLGALSYHLRHFNLKMTLKYVLDDELNKMLGEEFHSLTVSKMQAIANETIAPAGILGKALARAIEKMRREIVLFDENDLEQKIERYIDDKGLRLKATPWGYCGASGRPSNIRRAACQKESNMSRKLSEDGSPDETGSDESTCARCFFHLTDQSREAHWREYGNRMEDSLNGTNLSPRMREHISARARVIKIFVQNSFGKSEVV